MKRFSGIQWILSAACLGVAPGPLFGAGPDGEYRAENPFHAAAQSEHSPSDNAVWPLPNTAEPTDPSTADVAQTTWDFAPPPAPAPADPPVPPEHREAWGDPIPGTPTSIPEPPHQESGSASQSVAESVVPWSAAPPTGLKLTPPGIEYPTVRVTGFFQADAVIFDQDDANKETVGDVPNGADFRRARLAATGDVYDNVGYMIEMDFAAPGRPSFMDVYMDLRDMPWLPGTLRIGQWRQPFGMTSLTSVRELTFLERPLQQTLVPFRQIGIGLIDPDTKNNTTWAISGFRYPTDVYGGNVGDSSAISMATRLTAVYGGETETAPLVHIGGDYSFLNSSFEQFAFRSQPEVFVNEVPGPLVPGTDPLNVPPFVDTGNINGSSANLFGAELAGRAGSMWVQTEAYFATVNQIAASNPSFWGAYVQAGYILTGEVRPYSKANGVFTRVVPNNPLQRGGGLGAWEVAARLSTIDLNDANIAGGRLTNLAAGLNWYLNQRTKFQFNYIHPFLDRAPVGESDANILAARAQIDF